MKKGNFGYVLRFPLNIVCDYTDIPIYQYTHICVY